MAEVALTSCMIGATVGALVFGHIAPRVNSNTLIVVCLMLISISALLSVGIFNVTSILVIISITGMAFFGLGVQLPVIPILLQ